MMQEYFFASGNGGTATLSFPASLTRTIAVGASTNADVRAAFSQFGTGTDTDQNGQPIITRLDVVAPGVGIYSTDRTGFGPTGGYNDPDPNNPNDIDPLPFTDYNSVLNGTSFASPLAAGIGALLLSVNPALRPDDIRAAMQDGADQVGGVTYDANGWHEQYGHGGVDALASLRFVLDKPAVFVNSSAHWLVDRNGDHTYATPADADLPFGNPYDLPVLGDWGGEASGQTRSNALDELAVFRNGEWFLDTNQNNAWDTGIDVYFTFGTAGDLPMALDWNGDGLDEWGVFRPSNARWYIDMNHNVGAFEPGTDLEFQYGLITDIPITGDFGGDGADEIAVFRDGTWYIDNNHNGNWDTGIDSYFTFGQTGDIPVPGQWWRSAG